MVIDKQNIRKIPTFYHIPRCAGTFTHFKVIKPSLMKQHYREIAKLIGNKKKAAYSEFIRIDINLNNSTSFPGNITFYVSLNPEAVKKQGYRYPLAINEFKQYLKQGFLVILGIIINPLHDGILPCFSLIEEICQLASCEPHYFTILRKPFDWHRSMFYYLRDVGTWEPTYGTFNSNMTFHDYIHSDLLADSWIIRNLIGLPKNKQITIKEYDETVRILSKLHVGFLDAMPKFIEKLKEEFGFSVHEVKTTEDLTNRNKISKKENISELSKKDVTIFNERTKYDGMLYNYFVSKSKASDVVVSSRIYTFYGSVKSFSNERKRLTLDMIQEWKKSWSRAGWKPIVLSPKDAEFHPYYKEYVNAIKKQQSAKKSLNSQDYEVFCFLRWLAVANKGGGYMCDYDVLNNGNFKSLQETPGKLTSYQAHVPCLVSGSAAGFLNACKIFATCNPIKAGTYLKRETNGRVAEKYNFSDMLTIKNILTEKDIIKIEIVLPFDKYSLLNQKEKREIPLVHFSSASVSGDNEMRINVMKRFNISILNDNGDKSIIDNNRLEENIKKIKKKHARLMKKVTGKD